jgi:hypothetical protein
VHGILPVELGTFAVRNPAAARRGIAAVSLAKSAVLAELDLDLRRSLTTALHLALVVISLTIVNS